MSVKSNIILLQEKLIECVRQYEVLYNTEMKEYSDAGLKFKLWQQIEQKCELASGAEARKQWKNLRDGYRCALKLATGGKSGDKAKKKIKPWKFLEQMGFLRPYMKDRERSTNLACEDENDSQGEEEDDTNEREMSQITEIAENTRTELQSPEQPEIATESEEPPQAEKRRLNQHVIPTPKKRRIGSAKQDQLQFLREQAEKREERAKDRQQVRHDLLKASEDSLKLFFDSMYVATTKLPPTQQRMIKSKLFQAVNEAEIVAETNQSLEAISRPDSLRPPSTNSSVTFVSSGPPSNDNMVYDNDEQTPNFLQNTAGTSFFLQY